jgi:quercetin dioxygenase-like cupin family protein
MKKIINKAFKIIIGMLILLSANTYAQDPTTVAPKNYKKVLLENEKVRVLQFEMTPGQVIPWHNHPNHVIYALSGGKIEITDRGKDPVSIEVKAGEAIFIPAVNHMAKNTGTTTIKLVITEIK